MTFEQEQDLSRIKTEFLAAIDLKYRKGATEHGGNLFDYTPLELLEMAMDECVDQWTYLNSLRQKFYVP